jgi:plastocyanin
MGSHSRTRAGIICTSAVAVLVGACGGPSEPSEHAARSSTTIALDGLAFGPDEVTVSEGTTVTWTNQDPVAHTVTSGAKGEQGVPGVSKGKPDRPDGAFDGALDDRGESFSFTFDEPGTYRYFCRIHGGMTGVVIVE